jgi:hypothetical protein
MYTACIAEPMALRVLPEDVCTYVYAEGVYSREGTISCAGSLSRSAAVPGITKANPLCVTGVKADRAWCLLTEQRNVYISLLYSVD